MDGIKFFTKIFFKFFILLLAFLIFIFGIFALTILLNINKYDNSSVNPETVYSVISKDNLDNLTETNKSFLHNNKIWLMILSEDGKFKTSYYVPDNIQKDYSTQEIISFTRWYLNDYPVFTFNYKNNILVFGYPKDIYSKFPATYFRIDTMLFLFEIFVLLFLLTIVSIFLIYYYSKKKLFKEIQPISEAILSLSKNESVNLKEKGNLLEIKKALNQTSLNLEESKKEREFWLRGISHDLRTPLTIISSYVNKAANKNSTLKETNIIQNNISKMEHILNGLNMTYMLENTNILDNIETINLKKLIRNTTAQILNSTNENIEIILNICEEECNILGNSNLLDRAIRNIILNSIEHNAKVKININLSVIDKFFKLSLVDNGNISEDKVKELNFKTQNKNIHGFGLLLVKKIIILHNGKIKFIYQNPGLKVSILLPKK